jgi:hypothetical protein
MFTSKRIENDLNAFDDYFVPAWPATGYLRLKIDRFPEAHHKGGLTLNNVPIIITLHHKIGYFYNN